MKRNIFITVLVLLAFGLSSCNYLDTTPSDRVSDKLVWNSPENARLAVDNIYHFMHTMGQFATGQSSVGLTEGMTDVLKYGSTALNSHMWFANQMAYAEDGIPAKSAAYFLGSWWLLYYNIREVNQGLDNLHNLAKFDEATTKLLDAEMRFFRGYMYFELVKRHKNVILYDEDMTKIKRDTPLSEESACWDFVKRDLEKAAEGLPATRTDGRITKGAALALLSRAMLYAERWQAAKDAADAVMKSGLYALTTKYSDSYSKTDTKEAILFYEYNLSGSTHSFDDFFSPGGDAGLITGALGTPTQEMVEMYELATGGTPDWSTWHTTAGTNATPPYALLEPRFAATILYNGASWKGRTIEAFVGGNDGYVGWKESPRTEGRSTTGYFLRKLVCEQRDLVAENRSTQPWIVIRYAEVLLNFAEAAANLDANSAEGKKALNDVRARVGLPEVTKTGAELIAAIQRERKIELAYEGQYYWDMRRWKRAATEFNNYRVHGLKIEKAGAGFSYKYVDCDGQNRYYPARLQNRIALPLDELQNNSAIEQFEEWK